MTFEEKMKALGDWLYVKCGWSNCDECEFYDKDGTGEDEYECGIRDHNGKIPYYDGWNVRTALGIEKTHEPAFPEGIRKSMMEHFTKVE